MNVLHRVGSLLLRRLLLSRFIVLAAVLAASGVPASLATTQDTGPRIYRLAKTSTFQRGCFAPCLCPVMERGTEEGTLVLTPAGSSGLFDNYVVSEVNWTVHLSSGELRVTGSGTYKVGGEFAAQQQLSLDLQVGDNPVQHFDSGLVVGGGDFPRIQITISVNGQQCFDTVFTLDASPVPPDQISQYRLLPESTFQRSCSGPCACAPGPQLPMRGTFFLVPLDPDPLFSRFAVARVKWQVSPDPASTTTSYLPLTGDGAYRVGGEFAVQQQMSLDLAVDLQPPVLFDSGLVLGGGVFPRIDIELVNGAGTCVTTTLEVHARPVSPRSPVAVP
jgi:hypothetical protein